MKKIRAVQIGMGAMGKLAVRYMTDHGVEIAGAVDISPSLVGKDAGTVAGIPELGVKVETDLQALLDRGVQAEIAVVMTQTPAADVFPYLKTCAEHKMDVVTISEDWYWPWRTEPELADEMDAIAKENGVSILATGIQDVHWSNLAVLLASSCHNLTEINGQNFAFLDELGAEVAKEGCYGWTQQEFDQMMSETEDFRAMAYTEVLYCIAHELRLHVTEEKAGRKPQYARQDVYLPSLDKSVKAGGIIGMNDWVELYTQEGIRLSGNWILKAKEDGDEAYNRWQVKGEPDLDLTTSDMHGECTTSIVAVNRIPDVINARPGLLTVADMVKPIYHAEPFGAYV